MALTNCTISKGTLTKIGGQNIGADNINLIITPSVHFSVTASNFTVGTLPTGVDSITITDIGTPGTFTNTLNVLVNLTDSFSMPAADTTITIDVDGAADKGEVIQKTVFLTEVPASGSNFAQSFNSGPGILEDSNTNYGTKTVGDNIVIFTRTLTCSTGYYFPEEPSYVITSNDSTHIPRYTVETTRTYLDDGSNDLPLQVIAFKVEYLVPNDNVTAADLDTITFSATAAIIYAPTREITNFQFDTTNIPSRGGVKVFQIYGTVGAAYNLNVVDAATTVLVTNGVHSNQVIGPKGYNAHTVTFGSSFVGGSYIDVTYNVTITTATSSPTTSLGSNISTTTPMYTVSQKQNVVLTLTRSGYDFGTISVPTTAFKSFVPGYEFGDLETNNSIPWLFTATAPSGTIVKRRDPLDTDFTTVGGGASGYEFALVKNTVTQTSSTVLTLDLDVSVLDVGTASKSLVLDLDNIINTPSAVFAQSNIAVANNTPKIIYLTSSDENEDTPTYSIVATPSKGSVAVNASTGVATYTPTSSSSQGNDTFTYKVNDSYQDSAVAQVHVVIASSGGGGTAPSISSYWSWNDSEVNNNYSLITSPAWQGTPAYTNSTAAGSSSFKANVASWSLDSTHVGYPSYCDNLGDIGITWAFKYNGATLVSGEAGINAGTSSVNQSSQTGTINLMEITVAVPNTHNSGNGLISGGSYTFTYQLRYDNVSQ